MPGTDRASPAIPVMPGPDRASPATLVMPGPDRASPATLVMPGTDRASPAIPVMPGPDRASPAIPVMPDPYPSCPAPTGHLLPLFALRQPYALRAGTGLRPYPSHASATGVASGGPLPFTKTWASTPPEGHRVCRYRLLRLPSRPESWEFGLVRGLKHARRTRKRQMASWRCVQGVNISTNGNYSDI